MTDPSLPARTIVESAAPDRLVPRDEFPVLADVTYLDTASIGLVPESVQQAVAPFARTVASRGAAAFDDDAEAGALDAPRARIAALLGARPDDLAIVVSASDALNQIAWWRRPQRGANVVCAAVDFPSVTYPWMRVARDGGAEMRFAVPRHAGDVLATDDLVAHIDRDTAVVCVSLVQYADGTVADTAALAAACREADALLVLDVTQAAGAIPLDVATSGADVVIASGYKWLCGGSGAAVCWLAPGVRAAFDPPFVGWRSTERPFTLDARAIPLTPAARKMEYGTPYYPAIMTLAASAEYLSSLGVQRINDHIVRLRAALREGIDALGGGIVGSEGSVQSGILSARFPGHDPTALTQRLKAAGMALACRNDALRFSIHFYNDRDDVDRALNAIEAALRP